LTQNSRNVDESKDLPSSIVQRLVESFETLMLSYSLFPLLEEITAQCCRMERLRRGIKDGPYQNNDVCCNRQLVRAAVVRYSITAVSSLALSCACRTNESYLYLAALPNSLIETRTSR
jgi:hypothetical protein